MNSRREEARRLRTMARARQRMEEPGRAREPVVFDLASSDDADEEETPTTTATATVPSAHPSRKRPRAAAGGAEASEADAARGTQATECSVCYEPCTLAGRHRLAALKCGHLFGKKCIDRWVAERKTCPNCSMVVRSADVLVLFSDHVAVVDNSGTDAMASKWEDERRRRVQAETDLSSAMLRLQQAETNARRLEAEVDGWKRSRQPRPQFIEEFRVPLTSSRVLAIAPSGSMLCVGESASATTHGFVKLRTADPHDSTRVMVHRQPVRDVSLSPREDLALTVAFDMQLVLTSLGSDTVALRIPLPDGRHGWSCAFGLSQPSAVYCGLSDGVVVQYDTRRPAGGHKGVVASFALQEKQPVHSVKLFRQSWLEHGDGLAAATFSGVSVWSSTTGVDASAVALSARHASIAGCCSLAVAPSCSGAVAVVSSRTQLASAASHSVFGLSAHASNRSAPLMPVGLPLRGHRTPSVLTRSTIWLDPVSSELRVASGDTSGNCAMVWDVTSGQTIQRLAAAADRRDAAQAVVDVQHSPCGGSSSGGRELLAVLRHKEVALFSRGTSR